MSNLLITEMLKKRIKNLKKETLSEDWDIKQEAYSSVNEIEFIFPQVRTLEQALITKEKEEERNRMVGILDEMIDEEKKSYAIKKHYTYSTITLEAVKERILSTN